MNWLGFDKAKSHNPKSLGFLCVVRQREILMIWDKCMRLIVKRANNVCKRLHITV